VLSYGPSNQGYGSRSGDNGSKDSLRSSSFMPSPYRTMRSSHYLAYDDIPAAVMTSPFAPLRRWRSMSPSAVESLLTLVSTM
jgi:hypothetical protein